MKNIYLIGHMGAGKTTIAPLLANYYNASHRDTDTMVEKMFDLEVAEIFKQHGEQQFRIYETAAVLQTTLTDNLVVATGGGVLKRPRNADFMKTYGIIIYLEISFEEQYRRLLEDGIEKRPILKTVDNLKETLKALHDARNFLYSYTADITIRVDGKTPKEIVNAIKDSLKKINYCDNFGSNSYF